MSIVVRPVHVFTNGIDPDRLDEEIDAAVAIGADLVSVSKKGSNLHLEFDQAPDESALDAVIAAHGGTPLAPIWLWDFADSDSHSDHREINYKTGLKTRLYKKMAHIFRGEVRCVQYYADQAFTQLVLQVDVVYTRNPINGLATERTTTRTWFRKDGSPCPDKKVTHKLYDNLHAMQEGRRRRTNVIDQLQLDVLTQLIVTTAANPLAPTPAEMAQAESDGFAYISKYEDALGVYIKTGDLSFKTPPANPNIADDSEPWLDNTLELLGQPGVTIRQSILNSLKEINEP